MEGNIVPEFSKVAVAILELYSNMDEVKLNDKKQIIPKLTPQYSKIQIGSALDELVQGKMLQPVNIAQIEGVDNGMVYLLTEKGKKYIAGK